MVRSKVWTEETNKELVELFPYTDNKILAKKYGLSEDTIRKHANKLGARKLKPGGPKLIQEDEFLERITPKLDRNVRITGKYTLWGNPVELTCTAGHIFTLVPKEMGVKKAIVCKLCQGKSTYIQWGSSPELVDKLVQLFNKDMPYIKIAKELGASESSIQKMVEKLGLTNTRTKFDRTMKEVVDICLDIGYEITNFDEITNSHEELEYICDKGHASKTLLYNFKNRGDRCSECAKGTHTSTAELEILSFISSLYDKEIITSDRSILGGRELDIVLPDIGLAFEYNGIYWHSDVHVDYDYHLNKTNGVLDFGYRLIHINEDEWALKKDIVKSRLLSMLGKSYKIYARKCAVKELSFSELKPFIDNNHIQGCGSPTSHNLGLFYNEELVACMTFRSPRFNSNYEFELIRYCGTLNTTVVGGASKLLKYFINKTGSRSIISYSDRRWSIGNLYEALGFKHSHTSEPNYRYYKGTKSFSRYACQKHKLKELFPIEFKDILTETEIMVKAGYHKVYDSGNDVWVLE